MDITKAKKLVQDCNKNLAENEYNSRTFKKVKGCSASDIETAKLYAETIVNAGSYSGSLMKPRGNVADILKNSGLLEEQ